MEDMRKVLELEKGEHFMVVWPPFPPHVKREIEDLLEREGYSWRGGGTASDSSECHFYFERVKGE